jgi:hypothetical protein
LVRIRVVFTFRSYNIHTWLGRTAHISTIDDEAFVEKFASNVHQYFV